VHPHGYTEGRKIVAYILEISQRVISGYREECCFKDEEGHNAEGTGPECSGECRWMDGDVREISNKGTSTYEMDEYEAEEYGSPVAWAAHYLSKHHPEITEASAGMTETFDAKWRSHVPENAELYGECDDNPFDPEPRRETRVRLTGEFDTYQRSKVFALALLDYHSMVKELREREGKGN
jgi:hypothetical protein